MQHESHSGIRRGLKASAEAILDLGWCGAAPRVQDVQPMRPVVSCRVCWCFCSCRESNMSISESPKTDDNRWLEYVGINMFIHDKYDKRPVVKSIRFLANLFLSPCWAFGSFGPWRPWRIRCWWQTQVQLVRNHTYHTASAMWWFFSKIFLTYGGTPSYGWFTQFTPENPVEMGWFKGWFKVYPFNRNIPMWIQRDWSWS